jgi:tetratricopeptide (TPR) repeat protein
VSAYSYAVYAQAAEAGARGKPCVALALLDEAVEGDSASVELWTRRGASSCACGKSRDYRMFFKRAEELDSSYAPLWLAKALCLSKQGRRAAALAAARRASTLAPFDVPTQLALSRILRRNGATQEALRRSLELVVGEAQRSEVLAGLVQSARDAGRGDLAQAASLRLGMLPSASARPKLRDLRHALWRKDDARAQAIGSALQLHSDDLAAHAILAARPDFALRVARLRVAAEPGRVDSRVVAMLAADLVGSAFVDPEGVGRTKSSGASLSRLGQLMFAELMQRRLSVRAAALWLAATQQRTPIRRPELCRQWIQRLKPDVRDKAKRDRRVH